MFSGNCIRDNDSTLPTIAIPVVLFFPDNEIHDLYVDGYFESIELANDSFKGHIVFYIQDVFILEYSPHYGQSKKENEFFGSHLDNAIAMFAVETIQNGFGIEFSGYANNAGWCKKFTGITYSSIGTFVFAHELGHLMQLSHVNDIGNIMHPTSLPSDAYFTDKQLSIIQLKAIEFSVNCIDS